MTCGDNSFSGAANVYTLFTRYLNAVYTRGGVGLVGHGILARQRSELRQRGWRLDSVTEVAANVRRFRASRRLKRPDELRQLDVVQV